jgi:menaquinone-dependent protoporphyrinogen oxidase
MTKILIGYGTTEGQTARIAAHIAEVIRSHGIEAVARDLKQSKDAGLDRHDAVIVGAQSIWASTKTMLSTSFGRTV